jgi:hypothetical protein
MAAVTAAQNDTAIGKMHVVWEGFAADADTGQAVALPVDAKRVTVQALGTFTNSLSVAMLGSNDGGNTWVALHSSMTSSGDPAVIALAAAGLVELLEMPDMVKPDPTAGSGGDDVDIHMIVYRE